VLERYVFNLFAAVWTYEGWQGRSTSGDLPRARSPGNVSEREGLTP
jgi:hypothetical protein